MRTVVHQQLQRGGAAQRQAERTDNALQEAALRILRQLPQQAWQGRSAFIAWLCALSRSQVKDLLRQSAAQKRGASLQVPLDEARAWAALQVPLDEARAWAALPGVETWADGRMRGEQLHSLLVELSEEQRTALYLHHSGYSHGEIGEVLGCSPEAARKQIARATAKLTLLVAQLRR